MEWLNEHHKEQYDVGILHLKGGELEERFNSVATHIHKVENKYSRSLIFRAANKLSRGKLAQGEMKTINKISKLNYNIIYANTVVALPLAVQIKKQSQNKVKLIAHVHEMQASLKYYIPNHKPILKYIDKIIVGSLAVKKSILQTWGLNQNKIILVYEYSKINSNKLIQPKENNEFIVGAAGNISWRKGHHIFIQVARYIKENYPNLKIKFIWVGKVNKNELLIIKEELIKLGLENVKFIGQQSNFHDYFNKFDLFLMTSREDPFPLVCIDVGLLGKPIICFDKATGTQEMLVNGGGKIVPYLNIERMAEEVINYYDDRKELQKDSKIVKTAFSDLNPDKQCPKIYDIINQL
jgi:glycosyltransferase involved in cell wall biosynthesis